MANDAESAIYNRLTTAPVFKPSGVKLFVPDWTLDPGDVVTVKSDGVSYPVPIYSMNLEWKKASKLNIQSTGSQKREPLSPLRRREYRSGRGAYRQQMEIEEDTQQQYEHFVEETDAYRKEIYRINGVEFDPETGKVIYQIVYETDPTTGEIIIDPETGEPIPVIDPETGEPMIAKDAAGNPIPVYNEESDGSIAAQVIRSAQEISQKVTQQDVNRSLTGYMQTTAWESKMGNYLIVNQDGEKVMKGIAEVVTMINDQNEGIVNINGNRVIVNATTSATIANTVYVNPDGAFWVKRNAVFGPDNGPYTTINGSSVKASTIQVNGSGTLVFSGSASPDSPTATVSLDRSDAQKLKNMSDKDVITGVQIAGPVNNVYTLQFQKASTGNTWNNADVTFSRATTLYKSNYTIDGTAKTAGWSSGTFTVRAEPQNVETSTRLVGPVLDGTPTKSSTLAKTMNVSLKVYYDDDSEDGADTGLLPTSLSVPAAPIYNDGWGAAYGKVSLPSTTDLAHDYIDIATPPSSVDGTALSTKYYVTVANYYAYIRYGGSSSSDTIVARVSHTVYRDGQESVAPTGTPTISNSTADSSTGKRTATLTIPYKGPDTTTASKALSGVDVTSIYNAGKAAGTKQTTYNVTFDVPFSDGSAFNTTKKVTVDCANIWNQGADDATPATPKYYIATDGDPIIMWKSSGGDYSNFCGWLYPRTEVTVLGTSGYFYQVSYGGVTGYISQSRVEYATSPTSPTDYPGKTGWSTFAENGYIHSAKTNTANVNLREGPGTSYSIILKMPADAQLYCMYDPADLPPDNQWNDVVYRKATHDLYLGCVDCSYINMEDDTITVTVNWLRHSQGDYSSAIPTFMVPNGGETTISSSAVSDTSYVNTPVSTGVDISDYFNPTKTGFYGRYDLAAVSLSEMYHKVNFTVSYSDGTPDQTYTCEFKSYKKTSSGEYDVGQIVYVYANNGASVIVRTVPSTPSGTYGNLTPHTAVTIVSGPDNGYYQIRYAQTGYNTVTGYINADNLRSSVQGDSNYNYTGWVKSEQPTITSRNISIVEVVHNRDVTTITPISTRFTLKSPYTTSGGGSLLVANSSARPSDAYNNHGSGYTRLATLTAYFSQVTHSSSAYNYTLEHSVIFTVTTKYSDDTSTSTTYVGKISSNKT